MTKEMALKFCEDNNLVAYMQDDFFIGLFVIVIVILFANYASNFVNKI